jgi:2-polyprenyl-3-methyl-5-hydroxy-6-metoxy-1,4-benzoquinol methylase
VNFLHRGNNPTGAERTIDPSIDVTSPAEAGSSMTKYQDYGYTHSQANHTFAYLWPQIVALAPRLGANVRVLDVGCGNGSIAGALAERGCSVVGIDLSEQGIAQARKAHPTLRFEVLPADDQVLINLNEPPFDLVISTEVVEHLYDPRSFAKGCFTAVKPRGRCILSTPYHGYLKNLMISLAGKWDSHISPLWDGGHIKFWSRKTLGQLLTEAGFTNIQFRGAGRFPQLWMSMVMSGDRKQIP